MAAPRKKWSTTWVPVGARHPHGSKAGAYRYVQARAAEFHAGMLRPDATRVIVWVDEGLGRGWQKYETLELADLPAEVA
jgi:hypothetical protein